MNGEQEWWQDHMTTEIEQLRTLLDGHAEAPYLEASVAYWAGTPEVSVEPRPDDFPGMDVTTAWLAATLVRDLYHFAKQAGPVSERQWRKHCANSEVLAERVAKQMTIAGREASELIFPGGL